MREQCGHVDAIKLPPVGFATDQLGGDETQVSQAAAVVEGSMSTKSTAQGLAGRQGDMQFAASLRKA
jgi:hypothetical protein